MKTYSLMGVLIAATVSASAASAQPDASQTVSVIGRTAGPKIHTYGPDQNGHYTLRIDVADLDLSTPDGQRVMERRVGLGAAELCDATAGGGELPGFYNASKRGCISDTEAAARAQLVGRSGSSIATLDLTSAVERR